MREKSTFSDEEFERISANLEENRYEYDYTVCECGDPIAPIGVAVYERSPDDEFVHIVKGIIFTGSSIINKSGNCSNPRPKRVGPK